MPKVRNGSKVAACSDVDGNLSVLSIPSDVEDRRKLRRGSANGRRKEWVPVGERRPGKKEQRLDDVEGKRICQALYRDIKKADQEKQSFSAQQRFAQQRAKEEELLA